MNKNILTLILILTNFMLFSQEGTSLKNRINNKVNKRAKASKPELKLYETLFIYSDYIEQLKSKVTNSNVEEAKKLNTLSRASIKELLKYKNNFKALNLTKKALRKKRYNIFVVDAESFLDKLNKQSSLLKDNNNNSDGFAKKTSSFFYKYSSIINFKQGSRLALSTIAKLSDYKENSLSLIEEYNRKKLTLKDEFKIANKSTGIIDHYSKKALYSEVFSKIENINSNTALKTELEKNIDFYEKRFNENFTAYHKQFPSYFIKKSNQMNSFYNLYNSLGFNLENGKESKIIAVVTKAKMLKNYINTSEFDDYSVKKNSDLMHYSFINSANHSNPFEQYTYTKTKANPILMSWLNKEESLFNVNYSNYNITSVIPISNTFGRYKWGVWEAKDGTIIKNAYAQKQMFIVTYRDLKSNKCYASNFTASYLENNNVLVSNDEIEFKHTRLINCN